MQHDVNTIIRYMAEREGISEQALIDSMQAAIDAGYDSNDPAVRAHWAAMPFAGRPSPQALILYMAERL